MTHFPIGEHSPTAHDNALPAKTDVVVIGGDRRAEIDELDGKLESANIELEGAHLEPVPVPTIPAEPYDTLTSVTADAADGIEEYCKRLRRTCDLEVHYLKDRDAERQLLDRSAGTWRVRLHF